MEGFVTGQSCLGTVRLLCAGGFWALTKARAVGRAQPTRPRPRATESAQRGRGKPPLPAADSSASLRLPLPLKINLLLLSLGRMGVCRGVYVSLSICMSEGVKKE